MRSLSILLLTATATRAHVHIHRASATTAPPVLDIHSARVHNPLAGAHGAAHAEILPPPTKTLESEEARITVIGAGVNVALSASKAIVGAACGSRVLVADAAHSFSDLVSDGAALMAVRLQKTSSPRYPGGCRKAGALGAAAIAGLLLACGASLAAGQVSALLPGAVRTTTSVARGPCALVAALSIASKEMLARATMRIGRRHRSAAVLANAKHHRSDALSSVVALAGVVGTRFGAFVDPAAALLVAGCVLKMGVETGQEALLELLDARDPEAEAAVHQAVAAAIPSEYAVESVAVTGRATMEVRLLVPGSTSARDVDHACRAAQRAAKRAAPDVQLATCVPVVSDERPAFPRLKPLVPKRRAFKPAEVARPKPAERFEPQPASHEPIVVRPRILLAPTTLDVFKPGVGAVDPKRCPLIASLQ